MAKTTLKMKQDKICKNSVRYSASKEELSKVGVKGQPFTIYVPNGIAESAGDPPTEIEMTLSFK